LAATPVTNAVDIEVPVFIAVAVVLPVLADKIKTPGA
jgi:hypothetical protein